MPWTTIIDSETLAVHVQNPGWVVCDCRFDLGDPPAGERAYAEAHIPGAYYMHLDRDLSGPREANSGRHPLPDPARLAQRLGDLGIDDQTQVVAYDQAGGMIAARLWWLLRWLGHEAVAVLDGGWQGWCSAQHPVSTLAAERPPRRFVPRADAHAWLSSADLQRHLAAQSVTLVDARNAARFRGEQEPIDPVAGHVPGALNRPCQDNLDAAGYMRAPEALRRDFQAVLGGAATDVVHMCGSGVTACHNLLAMEMAGLPGSRLYVGSWSEWIRDPARPIATGEHG